MKAKPTATGGPPGTLTQVMTGQIDIGWAAPPFGIKEIKEGKIRIVARGSDMPSLQGQTVRAIIVNAECAEGARRDAIMRFAKGYREAVDWMYADPKALAMYAEKVKQPVEHRCRSRSRNFTRSPRCRPTRWPISTARCGRGEAEIPRCAADQGAAGRIPANPAAVAM